MILILLLVTECIHSTQAVKPGRCPNNRNPDLECPSVVRPGECADDSSCPGNQKCCRFGCLPRCVDPEPDCPPVCLIFCPFGNVLDANGCPTCKCKPGPECPPVCDIYCEFGNVLDSNGCPTCRCKAAGNCPNGNALANIFCGRGPGRQDCPPGYSCNIVPLDRFAVCCPDTVGNCPSGNPLANIFCGRGPARQDCPPGYSCNIDPLDRFAVCCPDKKCPTEPVDYRCKFYRRSCDDDSSCTDGKKCCRQGCSYVCVNPFKM